MPSQTVPTSNAWSRLDITLLTVLLLMGGLIRTMAIGKPPSMDELWHLALSTGRGSPLASAGIEQTLVDAPDPTTLSNAPAAWHVWTGMDGVLHPPLYVLTLRLWRDLLGPSDLAGQLLSLAWSLIGIAFAFAAVRRITEARTAFAATALLCFGATQIYFAQEIRGYAMLAALSAIALWQMAVIETTGPTRRRGVLIALMVLPLLLTHYFAFGVCLAIAIYLAMRFRGKDRVASLGALAGAGAMYAAIWLPFAIRQLHSLSSGDEFLRRGPLTFWQSSLAPALATPMRLLWPRDPTEMPPILIAMAAYALPLIWRKRLPRMFPWWLMSVCVVGSLLALDAVRGTAHLQFIRYVAAASVAAPPLMVISLAAFRPVLGWVFATALCGLLLYTAFEEPRYDSPDKGPLARVMLQRMMPREPLVVVREGEFPWMADGFVLHLLHESGGGSRTILKTYHVPTGEQLQALQSGTAWVLFVGDTRQPGSPIEFEGARVIEVIRQPKAGIAYRVSIGSSGSSATTSATTRPR